MSDRDNFDDFFKQELNKYSADVPPRVWENIVAARKKNRPVFFWLNFLTKTNLLILAGIFLASTATIWYINTSISFGNTNKDTNTSINSQAKQVNNKKELVAINIDKIQSINKNTVPKNIDKSILQNEKIAAVQTKTLAEQPPLFTLDQINNSVNAQSKKSLRLVNVYNNTLHNRVKRVKKFANEYNDIDALAASNTAIFDNGIYTKNTVNQMPVQSFLLTRLGDMANKIPLPIIDINSTILSRKNFPDCPSVEKNIAGNKQYLVAYISPDYIFRNITDTANTTYLNQRKQTTKLSTAYSAGIRYTKVFNNGISIAGGINYSQINEKFTFVQDNITEITYVIDPRTHDTTAAYTISGTRYKTSYNHYRNIDIPLLLGYELGNDKWHVNINAGPIINMYSWQQGEVLNNNATPISITTGKNNSFASQYKTNLGVGLTGGVSIFYKLNNQLHVFAEPYFRYNFGSMINNESSIQQKYTTIGMHVGIRVDF